MEDAGASCNTTKGEVNLATTKKAETTEPTPEVEDKKPVTPREDPIARASRILEETIEKAKEKAAEQLAKAEDDLAASQRNVDRAVRVRDERAARVERLKAHAQGNAAASYAAALGQTEVPVYYDPDQEFGLQAIVGTDES